MKKILQAKGKKRQHLAIGGNSELVAHSNDVFSAKDIRADGGVYILNNSIIGGDHHHFRGHDSPSQRTALDYLEHQLKDLFVTLGYHYESYHVRTEDYLEWIINIMTPRRRYDRILVRAVEGEAEIGDVTALRQAVRREKTDTGWLVAVRRISQSARTETKNRAIPKLFCYTLDDLLDEHTDFSRYFDWLEDEVRRWGIDKMYVPLACIKKEFDPVTQKTMGESRYDERNGWIHGYIDLWLDDPAEKHIFITGEAGTGKTWFSLHYAWLALQRYRQAKERGVKRPRLPLYVPLRDYAKAASLESFFFQGLFPQTSDPPARLLRLRATQPQGQVPAHF